MFVGRVRKSVISDFPYALYICSDAPYIFRTNLFLSPHIFVAPAGASSNLVTPRHLQTALYCVPMALWQKAADHDFRSNGRFGLGVPPRPETGHVPGECQSYGQPDSPFPPLTATNSSCVSPCVNDGKSSVGPTSRSPSARSLSRPSSSPVHYGRNTSSTPPRALSPSPTQVAVQGSQVFNISKSDDDTAQDDAVVRVMLPRRIYRPGECVRVHLNFALARLPCYRCMAFLEAVETLDASCCSSEQRRNKSKAEFRRSLWEFHEYTLYCENSELIAWIPADALPNFSTDLMDYKWVLSFKFVIRSQPPQPLALPRPLPPSSSPLSEVPPSVQQASSVPSSSSYGLTSLLKLPLSLLSSRSPDQKCASLPSVSSVACIDTLWPTFEAPLPAPDDDPSLQEVECLNWELSLRVIPHVYSFSRPSSHVPAPLVHATPTHVVRN